MAARSCLQRGTDLSKPVGSRAAAALILREVLVKNHSLDSSIDPIVKPLPPQELSLCKAICYGVLRHYFTLSASIDPLLERPIRNKDREIHLLMLIGAYQLTVMRVPDYAAIDSCVNAARELNKPWACGLINAVLRKVQKRGGANLESLDSQTRSEHPLWLFDLINKAWPQQADAIFAAANQEPPLCLRVNTSRISRDDFCRKLELAGIPGRPGNHAPTALYLPEKPGNITELPGFAEGECSVQDEAPQLAVGLLDLAHGQRILDACAAPGGKTCHILENLQVLGGGEVIAIDREAKRLQRLHENLARLQLSATCKAADILDLGSWWDGKPFDRILCDVPCSGTGVIRRHPDIKFLRRPNDIPALAETQLAILNALWPCLKPGGILLYATCSILPQENREVVDRFCDLHKNCGIVAGLGGQLFPEPDGHDGFFYARLAKSPDR
jgi:16S rRNA (cytosine967-C5)-methyltransferase